MVYLLPSFPPSNYSYEPLPSSLDSLVRPVSQAETLRQLIKQINILIRAAKRLLARTHCINGHVSKRMDPLALTRRQRPVHHKPAFLIRGIDVIIAGTFPGDCRSRRPWAGLVHPVLFPVVGVSTHSCGDYVARVPVQGEVRAGVVRDSVGGLDCVLREAGVLVDAYGVSLCAVVGLGGHVLRVGGAEYICGKGKC